MINISDTLYFSIAVFLWFASMIVLHVIDEMGIKNNEQGLGSIQKTYFIFMAVVLSAGWFISVPLIIFISVVSLISCGISKVVKICLKGK